MKITSIQLFSLVISVTYMIYEIMNEPTETDEVEEDNFETISMDELSKKYKIFKDQRDIVYDNLLKTNMEEDEAIAEMNREDYVFRECSKIYKLEFGFSAYDQEMNLEYREKKLLEKKILEKKEKESKKKKYIEII